MAFCRKAGNLLGGLASNQIRCMSTSKLFIRGLSPGTDDATLKDAFSKYGEVAEAKVIVNRHKGRSKGFAFVTYSCVDEAAAAVEALNNENLHGRRIKVNYANDRVRANEGEGGGFVTSSGDQKSGGGGGGKATAAAEIPDDQEYYATKAGGAGHGGAMMEVIFYASSYYDDRKS